MARRVDAARRRCASLLAAVGLLACSASRGAESEASPVGNGMVCFDTKLRCLYSPSCGGAECSCEPDEPEDSADAGTEDDAAPPSAHFICVHNLC